MMLSGIWVFVFMGFSYATVTCPPDPFSDTTLNCTGQGLTEVPGNITNLTNLQSLNLADNQISSLNDGDFLKLTELRRLNLENNTISTINDNVFRHAVNLRFLVLDSNPIKSISMNAFMFTHYLEEVSLRSTLLTTVPRAIAYIPSLRDLFLENTPVRCDCELIWSWALSTRISGKCFNLESKISDYARDHVKPCKAGTIIG